MTFRIALMFVGGLIIPQAVGFFCLRRTMQRKQDFRLILSWLTAPALFFVFAYLFWSFQAESIRDGGHYVCGAFGAAAYFSTLYGTILHLGISCALFLQMWLWDRRRKRRSRNVLTADQAIN